MHICVIYVIHSLTYTHTSFDCRARYSSDNNIHSRFCKIKITLTVGVCRFSFLFLRLTKGRHNLVKCSLLNSRSTRSHLCLTPSVAADISRRSFYRRPHSCSPGAVRAYRSVVVTRTHTQPSVQ